MCSFEASFAEPDATVPRGALSMNVYVHLILTYFGGFVKRLPQARGGGAEGWGGRAWLALQGGCPRARAL